MWKKKKKKKKRLSIRPSPKSLHNACNIDQNLVTNKETGLKLGIDFGFQGKVLNRVSNLRSSQK